MIETFPGKFFKEIIFEPLNSSRISSLRREVLGRICLAWKRCYIEMSDT